MSRRRTLGAFTFRKRCAVKLYLFDEVDERLELLPLAARRALDAAGLRLSREAWSSLPLPERTELTRLGSGDQVESSRVRQICAGAVPAAESIEPRADPEAGRVPADVACGFGPQRPLPDALWVGLSALDRYALAKVVQRGRPRRVAGAYDEIVGASALSTHLSPGGDVRMVGVAEKAPTLRRASAESAVSLSAEGLARLSAGSAKKGDVLATARIAGIQAAKRTPEWIPLCHAVALTRVEVTLVVDVPTSRVRIVASAEALDRTGVEMEALVAASAAALTVYDMLKAYDRGMELGPTRLLSKSGGRSGDYQR
jgi:cyclic pyranopterin phosphate synthase